MNDKTVNDKAMNKAYQVLNDIHNNKTELQKHFNCLMSFYSATAIYNELYKHNSSETFLHDSAIWFKNKGFKVYYCNDGINYLIVNDSYNNSDTSNLKEL